MGVVPSVHRALVGGHLKGHAQASGALVNAELQKGPPVVGVGGFGHHVVHERVFHGHVNAVEHEGAVGRAEPRALVHLGAGAHGDHEIGAESFAGFAPQGEVLAPSMGMRAERVELHLGAGGVACGGEGVLDVKVAVAVVSIGTHEHHAVFRQAVDEHVAQGGAVWGSPLWQSPAVVDDQTFVVRFRHVLHPSERIQRRRLVHHQRGQEQLRRRGHAGEPSTRASARRNARHVGAVGRVPVHVGRVASHELDFPRFQRSGPVVEAVWRLPGGAVLVPNPSNAGCGQGGVVEHGVGVVEAPVEDPDEDPFAVKRRRQAKSGVHAVHPCAVPRLVQVGHRPRRQFHPVHGQGDQQVQVIHVDAERGHAVPASPRKDSLVGLGPSAPSRGRGVGVQLSNEAHRGLALDQRHRVSLGGKHQRFGVWMLGREEFELGQRLAVDRGHGLAPSPTSEQKCEEEQTTAKDNHVFKGRQSVCPFAGLTHSKQIVHV